MRYRLRELCRLYLPWLFACLCVFACPPREHSSSLSLSLSTTTLFLFLDASCCHFSGSRYHSIDTSLRTNHFSSLTETRLDGFAYEERGLKKIDFELLVRSESMRIRHAITFSFLSLSFFRLVSLSIVDSSRSLSSCLPKRCRSMHHPPPPATTNHHHHTDSYDRSNSPHSLLFFF